MNQSPLLALRQGAIVIVPNQRAEQYLTVSWIKQEEKLAVPGDRLYALSRWLRTLWLSDRGSFSYKILSEKAAQTWWALQLWKHQNILQSQNYITLLYGAYQRCTRFGATPEQIAAWPLNGPQQEFLKDWVLCLEEKKRAQILFQDDLLSLVARSPAITNLKGKRVVFYDFETFDPVTLDLIEALKQAEVLVEISHSIQPTPSTYESKSFFYENKDQELQAALTWLQQQPLALRSAIVVPDMSGDFSFIKAQIHSQLEGDDRLYPLEQQRSWLAVSSGTSLLSHPLIAEVLSALKGDACDKAGLISNVQWDSYHQVLPPQALWDEHVTALKRGLTEYEWLLDATLSSEEYQATRAFYTSLEELLGLCPQNLPITSRDFLHFFEIYLSQCLFQPQSLTDKKMILGLLEAAALPWDAIWFFQGHAKNFPPALNPHPLLPYEWQVQNKLPQASLEKEWQYFKSLLERFFQGTADISVSSSGALPQDWAPLWRLFNVPTPKGYAQIGPALSQNQFLRVELFHSNPVKNPARVLSVSTLNAFIQCPFKGFALSLPEAKPVQEAHPVFDPRSLGKITHLFIEDYLQKKPLEKTCANLFDSWPDVLKDYTVKQLMTAAEQLAHKLPGPFWHESIFVEKSFEYQVGNTCIKGRADLVSNSGRVIDIKTSTPILNHWFHDQPLDWQGAIYALALKKSVLGLLMVSSGSVSYWERDTEQWLPSWERGLSSYITLWQQGDYQPKPQTTSHCTHCLIKDSCRYHLQDLA